MTRILIPSELRSVARQSGEGTNPIHHLSIPGRRAIFARGGEKVAGTIVIPNVPQSREDTKFAFTNAGYRLRIGWTAARRRGKGMKPLFPVGETPACSTDEFLVAVARSRVKFVPPTDCPRMENTMSVSAISPAPVNASSASLATAADGDYKARNALSAQAKDSDGDFKPIAAAGSAAAQSSSVVQSALPSLKKGG
jgi:hypothetical protein